MTQVKPQITESQREATNRTLNRIAELKIQMFGLKDTPKEYIEKCKQKGQ